ncbi:hypothetical protein IAU60_006938 [Kwoniella sp. DSM 27419]
MVAKRLKNDATVLHTRATQADVWQEFAPYAARVLEGESSMVMAYGPTGSGKSFTVFGTNDQPGILKLKKRLHLSTLYVYNDKVFDLLADGFGPVCDHRGSSTPIPYPYVQAMPAHLEGAMASLKQRTVTSKTQYNNTGSSRGHTVYTLGIDGTDGAFVLVDLAGSERDHEMTGDSIVDQRLKQERKDILQDLETLGRVSQNRSTGVTTGIRDRTFEFGPSLNEHTVLTQFCRIIDRSRLLSGPLFLSHSIHLICTVSLERSKQTASLSALAFAARYQQIVPTKPRKKLVGVRDLPPLSQTGDSACSSPGPHMGMDLRKMQDTAAEQESLATRKKELERDTAEVQAKQAALEIREREANDLYRTAGARLEEAEILLRDMEAQGELLDLRRRTLDEQEASNAATITQLSSVRVELQTAQESLVSLEENNRRLRESLEDLTKRREALDPVSRPCAHDPATSTRHWGQNPGEDTPLQLGSKRRRTEPAECEFCGILSAGSRPDLECQMRYAPA